MAKTLQDIELPWQMQWIDEFLDSTVESSVLRDLQGRLVITNMRLVKGRKITLEAVDGISWVTAAFVAQIVALADSNGVYQLVWDTKVYDVVFRHNEPPAVSFDRIAPFSEYIVGTIKLMGV